MRLRVSSCSEAPPETRAGSAGCSGLRAPDSIETEVSPRKPTLTRAGRCPVCYTEVNWCFINTTSIVPVGMRSGLSPHMHSGANIYISHKSGFQPKTSYITDCITVYLGSSRTSSVSHFVLAHPGYPYQHHDV